MLYIWRRQWHPTPVLLLGKSHRWRSLVGCSPWGRWESDITERLHFHFSLSCIGEGNGNPLQCSCLENPRDGGAWWGAVSGVAQSRTRLKRRSSSSMLPEGTWWIFNVYSLNYSLNCTVLLSKIHVNRYKICTKYTQGYFAPNNIYNSSYSLLCKIFND